MRETARVQVIEPGLSTVQDLGRADGPRSGQMAGGALDQYSARMANTLVASDPDAALLELVALDFAATTDADLLVAVTGADADVTVDGHPQPQWEPVVWRAGTRLAVRRIRSGLRVYLAVHGTLHTRRLLGSCAPDTVLGLRRAARRGRGAHRRRRLPAGGPAVVRHPVLPPAAPARTPTRGGGTST